MFLKEPKCNLQSAEFVGLCNFAEERSLVLQDEAQRIHQNNAQATIHPSTYPPTENTLNHH
jgi:hypothetical protein